ncbi:MAG: hypothetical protein L6R42_003759, partial [Xanthoria sp. 1 TBL-2021]
IHEVQKSRDAIGKVLEKWRNGGGEIVHILHKVPDGAPLFTPGTELAEEFEELKSKDGEEVINKPHPCAFTDTTLDAHLKKSGKSKIVLVGYMAHVCVSATSRIGAELGYDVSVVSDAIGDRDIPGAKAGQLVDVSTLVFYFVLFLERTVLAELGDVSATIVKSADL